VTVGGGSWWSSTSGILGLGTRLVRADSRNDWLSSGKGSGWIFLRGVVYSCFFAGFLSNGLILMGCCLGLCFLFREALMLVLVKYSLLYLVSLFVLV
jgi:hypothetical protein